MSVVLSTDVEGKWQGTACNAVQMLTGQSSDGHRIRGMECTLSQRRDSIRSSLKQKRDIYDLKVTVQWLVKQGGRGAEVNYR